MKVAGTWVDNVGKWAWTSATEALWLISLITVDAPARRRYSRLIAAQFRELEFKYCVMSKKVLIIFYLNEYLWSMPMYNALLPKFSFIYNSTYQKGTKSFRLIIFES